MAGYLIAETTREEREKIVEILRRTATVVWQGWLRCIRNTLMGRKSFARSIWNLTQDT